MKNEVKTGLAVLLLAVAATLTAQTSTGDSQPRLGVRIAGILIESVDGDSVAARGGLKPGDVLLAWERTNLSDVEMAREMLESMELPATVQVLVLRGDERINMKLEFAKSDDGARLGVTPVYGVRVDGVIEDTVASRSDFAVGDVIVGSGDEPIETFNSLKAMLKGLSANDTRVFRVLRGGREQDVLANFGSGSAVATVEVAPRVASVPFLDRLPDTAALERTFQTLADLDVVQKEIDEIVKVLESGRSDTARQEAIDRLRGVRGRMSQLASMIGQIKSTVTQFGTLADGLDVVVDEMGHHGFNWKEMRSIAERAAELAGQGKSSQDIFQTLEKEFHGFPVERVIRFINKELAPSGQAEVVEEHVHPAEPSSSSAASEPKAPSNSGTKPRPSRVTSPRASKPPATPEAPTEPAPKPPKKKTENPPAKEGPVDGAKSGRVSTTVGRNSDSTAPAPAELPQSDLTPSVEIKIEIPQPDSRPTSRRSR